MGNIMGTVHRMSKDTLRIVPFFTPILGLLLLILAGCDTATGPDNLSGSKVSNALRRAIIDSAGAQFFALLESRPDSAAAMTLTALRRHTEIRSSGLTMDSLGLWGEFIDGYTFIVADNREGVTNGTVRKPESHGLQKIQVLPARNRFTVLNALGPNTFDTASRDIARWLRQSGYEETGVDFTPSGLRNRRFDGLLYVNSHGTGITGIGGGGSLLYSLWTTARVPELWESSSDTTPATPEQKQLYDDLFSQRVVEFRAKYDDVDGKAVIQNHYAITNNFVKAYMSFDSTIVFIDACSSHASDFSGACISRGASVYLGWSNTVSGRSSNRVARSFFAYTLGALYDSALTRKPSPRPFAIRQVLNLLFSEGLIPTPDHNRADLKAIFSETIDLNSQFLAPSIEQITMEGYFGDQSIMVLHGAFGSEQGSVTVDGVNTPIVSWDPTMVRCRLPDSGAGSAGNVVVTAHGIRSNAVPLTEWRGEFTTIYNDQVGGGTLRIILNFHLRADVHRYRILQGQDVTLGGGFYDLANDSWMGYVCSGGGTDANGTTYTMSGSGMLRHDPRPTESSHFSSKLVISATSASLDTPTVLIETSIIHNRLNTPAIRTMTRKDGLSVVDSLISLEGQGVSLPRIECVIDPVTYTIRKGEMKWTPQPGFDAKTTWNDITVKFPPTKETFGKTHRNSSGG
jgi:hypothetical protein